MADYLEPVVVELEGRDRKLLDTLTRAKAEIRRFTADVARQSATIKVDVKLKDGALAEVRRRVAESPAAKLKVDLQLAAGQRDQLRAQLEGRPITANVRPVMDQAALRRVQTVLRELGKRIDVQIRPQMDTGAQMRAQRRLDRMSQDRTVVIRTRVIGDANRVPRGGGSGEGGGGRGVLGALLTLTPALTPIAAQAAAVALQVGAATVAVGAFGLAVKSQLSSLGEAADEQKKYNDAVAKYGARSTQAMQAQRILGQSLAAMPAATRQAAGAFLNLKSDFKSWSDGLSKFTMAPVTQGLGVLDALLPKLSPLVKGASAQFTRLTTMLAAGVNAGAFDVLIARFTKFANGALKSGVDGLTHFARVLSQGGGSGAFHQFMDYAKANAPLVKETLKNLAEAVLNILKAASQAGPGMLTLINAFAKLVAALPPSVIATIMQITAAIKILSLTRAGITTLGGSIQGLMTRFTALRTAATTAGGGLAGLRAAFMSLGTAAKASVVVGGLALIAIGIKKLADGAKGAPPDVDKLTVSLKQLASTGKFTGELKKTFGDVNGLVDKIKQLNQETAKSKQTAFGFRIPGLDDAADAIANSISNMTKGKDSLDALKGDFSSLDKGLANMVTSGYAKQAAADFQLVVAAARKQGYSLKDINKLFGEYKSKVADANWAQQQAEASMGLFGKQAFAVQEKLNAQKAAVQGLQQAILDLNDTNRGALDAESAYQQAIDDATAAIKGHSDALHFNNGVLDLRGQKAREAYAPLSQLAVAAQADAKATLEQTGSQDKANRVLIDAHAQLVRVAKQMGLSTSEANTLANQLDNIKDPKIQVTVKKMQAETDLRAFNAAVKRAPNAKSVTLKTLSATAEQVLEKFGFKVTHLKNGQVKITAKNGQALSAISGVKAAVAGLHGKTITIMTQYFTAKSPSQLAAAHGRAHGGLAPGYAGGGQVLQTHPNGGLIRGPGSSTSDSIVEVSPNGGMYRTSDREYIVQSRAVDKYGVGLLDALNAGHLKLAAYARGGLAQGEKDARKQLTGSFGISNFGRQAGYWRTPFEHQLVVPTDINALVDSLNGFRSEIKKAFRGHTESSLLKQLDKAGKSLISYDKQLNKVTASLASAKSKLDDLKNSAAQLKSSVASSVMQNAGIVTTAPQEGFALTSQDVLNNMSTEVSKSLAFSNQLQALKKRGLSADLLEQIASAGVDQGGATAAALTGASDSTIKQLNSMQSQLKKSASAAGSAVADQMYGAGIRAAEGLVKGLQHKQKAIEDAMLKIAKSMEKAIKHALKIKSPSQVMASLGDYTALGLAHGIERSSKYAVVAARGMAMSVAQGAVLTGGPTWTGAPPSGARAAKTEVHHHMHLTVEGHVLTERKLRDVMQEQMLRLGMRNPATYAPYRR